MNINKKVFLTTLSLVFTSITCTSCNVEKQENKDLITYNDLVNNYKLVEFDSSDKRFIYIVKKEKMEDMDNYYGYYDIIYHKCIVKVDEEKGVIIGKGVIDNIIEMDIEKFLEIHNIKQDKFSNEDLGIILEMFRDDYLEKEKVLVK